MVDEALLYTLSVATASSFCVINFYVVGLRGLNPYATGLSARLEFQG